MRKWTLQERTRRDELIAAAYTPGARSPDIAAAVAREIGMPVHESVVRKVLQKMGLTSRGVGRPRGPTRKEDEPTFEAAIEPRGPTLREQYDDLKDRHRTLLRAAIRLIGAYDPTDPDEVSQLVHELAVSAGISSQLEAIAIIEDGWQTPVRSSHGLVSTNEGYLRRR